MEDRDGDKDLKTGSVHNLTSDTYFYLTEKENKSDNRRRRQKEYKVKGLGRAQAVSENGRPRGFCQGRFTLLCAHDNIT